MFARLVCFVWRLLCPYQLQLLFGTEGWVLRQRCETRHAELAPHVDLLNAVLGSSSPGLVVLLLPRDLRGKQAVLHETVPVAYVVAPVPGTNMDLDCWL